MNESYDDEQDSSSKRGSGDNVYANHSFGNGVGIEDSQRSNYTMNESYDDEQDSSSKRGSGSNVYPDHRFNLGSDVVEDSDSSQSIAFESIIRHEDNDIDSSDNIGTHLLDEKVKPLDDAFLNNLTIERTNIQKKSEYSDAGSNQQIVVNKEDSNKYSSPRATSRRYEYGLVGESDVNQVNRRNAQSSNWLNCFSSRRRNNIRVAPEGQIYINQGFRERLSNGARGFVKIIEQKLDQIYRQTMSRAR